MGIDYGRKRIGIAVTDPLNIFASPLKTVPGHEFDSFLEEYLKTEVIDAFIIGYPVQLNNQPSDAVKYIDPFIRKLEKSFPGIPVHRIDERFTSKMALKAMIEGGLKRNARRDKSTIDRTSAAIILQSFLDKMTNENKRQK